MEETDGCSEVMDGRSQDGRERRHLICQTCGLGIRRGKEVTSHRRPTGRRASNVAPRPRNWKEQDATAVKHAVEAGYKEEDSDDEAAGSEDDDLELPSHDPAPAQAQALPADGSTQEAAPRLRSGEEMADISSRAAAVDSTAAVPAWAEELIAAAVSEHAGETFTADAIRKCSIYP